MFTRSPQSQRWWNDDTDSPKEDPMIKIEAIIRPNKFESVKSALIQLGVEGMTVSEVRGHGRQKGHTEVFKGREYEVDLLPKIKLELVLEDNIADRAIDTILTTAYTGSIGDGKIFIYDIADVIRIRSRERGVAAI
jgi:nitrogen regulatory protein P-II 1